ncbi:hypothetical protein Pan97_04200 [Bremerella volcania]|uniref:Lipocalin-like domain-containing protein n=1 Tax=Bremerella volcania TaxID=2527984 RepID=A0A518C2J4_9BACT|nr:hypothetical protein [Bremerella volcania]QDU73449.1 hypothetical protein Pan97_04200 [Bremerella volcania]
MRCVMLLLFNAVLLTCGCKQYATLSPLADPDKPVYDDQLIGQWYGTKQTQDPLTGEKVEVPNTDNHFTFTKYGISGYKLSAVNTTKDTTIEFEAYPFQVGEHKFLQLQRPKFDINEQNAGILRVYYFAPYKIEEDKLYFKFTPTDRLRVLAEEDGVPTVETQQTLLFTGDRQQMLDFLERHMDELFPKDREVKPLHRAESLDLDMADEL